MGFVRRPALKIKTLAFQTGSVPILGLKELTTAESILKLSVDNNFNCRFN
jgi:hypothetical protein